jgi:hypothetical protein
MFFAQTAGLCNAQKMTLPSTESPARAYVLLSFHWQKMILLTRRHRGSLSKTTDRYVLFVFTVLTVMPR